MGGVELGGVSTEAVIHGELLGVVVIHGEQTVTEAGKRAQLAWSIIFLIFLHFWKLRFNTSLWILERTLEVLPSLSYRRFTPEEL